MRPIQLLATIASFSALTSAWPWPDSFENKAFHGIEAMFHKRQNSNSNTNSASANSASANSATSTGTGTSTGKTTTTTTTGKTTTTTTGKTTTSKGAAQTGTKTAAGTGSAETNGGGDGSANSTITAPSSGKTSFDSRDGPGSVTMISPGIYSSSQYYKIGDWVTFAWNYTSVQGTPTAIDIVASCASAQATFTMAMNLTYQPNGQTFLWDTGNYQATATQQLLTNTYTLIIADADLGLSATAQAGYLSPVEAYRFGMYVPQPYTPLADFTCPSCSGAMLSLSERQTLGFLFGMAFITILSFSWFATGRFGVL